MCRRVWYLSDRALDGCLPFRKKKRLGITMSGIW
jgi:hypothetical protein